MSSIGTYLKNKTKTDDDEDDLFCKSIVKKIQKFSIRKKNRVKIEILKFVSAEEENLDSE